MRLSLTKRIDLGAERLEAHLEVAAALLGLVALLRGSFPLLDQRVDFTSPAVLYFPVAGDGMGTFLFQLLGPAQGLLQFFLEPPGLAAQRQAFGVELAMRLLQVLLQ